MHILRKAICAMAVVLLVGMAAAASGGRGGAPDRVSRRSASGHIAVRSEGRRLPGNAEVSFARTHADDAKRKIREGWEKRRRGGVRPGPKRRQARVKGASGPGETTPAVLAMYDISIRADGRKWQPAAGEPVRVDVELEEPVTVKAAFSLGVVHLSDDGEVEELDSSRYGFTYNKEKSAVTAFWFSAEGFSVYAITEGADHTTDSAPARRLYDFYSLDFNKYLEDGVTSNTTYNTYVPRYFKTLEGNYTFRQIVTNNQYLVRPEALPSPLGRTFMGWYLYSTNNANKTVDGITYDADGYATTPFDFEDPVAFNVNETGEHEYVLRSQFDRVGYVIFHEQPVAGVWPITAVRRGIMEEVETNVMQTSVEISDLKVTYDDTQDENASHENTAPRMIFRGWSEAQVMPGEDTDVTGGVIRILSSPYTFRRTKDTAATPRHLFPVFVNINWLYFQPAAAGQAASYIPSRYYYADEGTNRFPVPARTGYTFNGWWTSTNATEAVQVADASGELVTTADLSGWGGYVSGGNLMLRENVTVYGAWTPAPTKYTVVVWKQKSTDAANLAESAKTYDFAESFTNTALAEKSISVDQTYKNWSGQSANGVHESDYTGFTYARCDAAVTVKGDGTTVLNVYYDRNVHTLTFYTSAPTYTYRYNGNSSFTVSNTEAYNSYIETLESNKRMIDGFEVSYRSSTYYFKRASASGSSWYQISGYSGQNVYNASSISVTTSGGTKVATVTGLYGASVKDAFPIVRESDGYTYTGKSWVGNRMYFQRLMAIELMPDVDIAFVQFSGDTYTGGTLEYYVETDATEDGAAYNATYGAYYKLYKTIPHDFNYLTYKEDFHPLDGYTNNITHTDLNFTLQNGEYRTGTGITGTHRFYYERLPYMVSFTDSYTLDTLAEVPVEYLSPVSNGVPKTVTSTREGYSFTGWYADSACSTRVFFENDDSYRSYAKNKVLIERMPAHNLQLFAGWEAVWYLIKIDPNGGELAPGDSLWFWKNYGYKEIHEYTTATRSFEESVNGTWFYALPDRSYYGLGDQWEDREDEEVDPEFAALISNRRAFYTTDQSTPGIRDVNKRYVQVPNAYRYAGWYEVKSDGTEELYAFGSPVQHDLHLRLHWKHLGTYRLHYDPGMGEMVERDENEETFKLLDSGVYADSSELLITRTAEPPEGYIFAGWRIRYGDGTVYHPGQSFVFNAAYAVNVPGPDGRPVKQLILDAVYTQVRTVSLTTDANGGTIDPTVATTLPLAYPNAPTLITNITDTARTVSGMRNNAYGHLSDGNGYVNVLDGTSLTFLGWNTKADGTGTHFDPGQYVGVDTLDAPNGHNVLYAEWGVTMYFDKNNAAADWNTSAWPTNCVWDETKNMFCQTNRLNGCATDPLVPLTSSNDKEMFRYWGIKRYSGEIEPYDFSAPITNASVTLYGVWSNRIEVAVHAVDTTDGARTDMDSEWLTTNVILVTANTYLSFETGSAGYADPGSGYAFMCANLADGHANVSEETMITNLYYNVAAQHVYVTYADGTSAPMPDDKEIYFVYFADPKEMDIAYKVMEMDGTLSTVSTRGNPPPKAVVTAAGYDVPDNIKQPRYCANNQYSYFAYAIGDPDANSDSQIHFITRSSGSDDDRPPLLVRNTCHGFQYSTDDGATWYTYGFNAKLYVIYFKHRPIEVVFDEKTLGTAADMSQGFDYRVVVEQTTVTNLIPQSVERRRSNKTTWNDYDVDPPDVVISGTSTIMDTGVSLANGMQSPCVLFSDTSTKSTLTLTGSEAVYDSWGRAYYYRTNYNVYVQIHQTITVTQTPKANFSTSNNGAGGDKKYVYTYTTTGEDDETGQRVTFTNTRESLPVELHVAFAQSGAIDHVDNAWRTETEADYTLTVPLSEEGAFEDALEKTNVILKAAAADRRFLGAYYGTAVETDLADENKVSLVGPVTSVGFVKKPDADWCRLCLNGDANLALGDYKIYYVYGEIPSIRYMKEGANGALTEIPTLTYVGNAVKMNGYEVSQGEAVDVPIDGTELTVGAGGTANFYVPLSLDGASQASLNYFALAAGPAGTASTNAMDGVTWGSSIRLKVAGGLLKWSVDGQTWGDFSGAAASIYAIYKEKGYDLTVAVDSLVADADKARDVFTVTVVSSNLLVGTDYVVSGYAPGGTPVDYVTATACDVGGMLTFTVTGGVRFTIQSLPNNEWPDPDVPTGRTVKDYVLCELLPSGDYALTNLLINGAAPLSQMQVENGTVTYMDMDKTVAFTNIKRYEVTFKDADGEELKAATPYWYGTKAAQIDAPGTPSKAMDAVSLYRFTDWTPALEDVGSNTVYTAAYRAIKIPQAAQRAADTNLTVTLDEQTLIDSLAAAGIDILDPAYSEATANDTLNARDPNGLRRWENLVTGTAFDQLPLGTAVGSGGTSLTMRLAADPGDATTLGYTILHELRKASDGGWVRVKGPVAGANPDLSIDLLDAAGKSKGAAGYYRVVTLIVPDSTTAITNEIPSTNIIGVMEVASPFANTMTAVPWTALASDPKTPMDMSVAGYVQAGQLSDGDVVQAMNAKGTYEQWTLGKASGAWSEAAVTVQSAGTDGASGQSATTPAAARGLSRGSATWVRRGTDASKPYFLVGQYSAEAVEVPIAGGTAEAPGFTMVTNPRLEALRVNEDIDWGSTPGAKDKILIPNDTGKPLILVWKNGKWTSGVAKYPYDPVLRLIKTVYETNFSIPSGTGFWYQRSGEGFNVTVMPEGTIR